MDKVYLEGIRVYGHHGHSDEEQLVGQVLEVDVELRLDLRLAGRTDQLEHTTDYQEVFSIVSETVSGGTHRLLENLASDIALQVLNATRVDEVLVRVDKPQPPVGGVCRRSGVEIVRRHTDFDDEEVL